MRSKHTDVKQMDLPMGCQQLALGTPNRGSVEIASIGNLGNGAANEVDLKVMTSGFFTQVNESH